ncbi:hypothetical protein GCM10009128_23630 [Psychrosphaera haliotis]|uniref:hypothetical protein n=1 Tax=Psychrosphaera haliotis TaxID=555083 RepID=UPI0031DF4663
MTQLVSIKFPLKLLISMLVISSFSLCAKQLNFNKYNQGNSIEFNYVWLDENEMQQTFAFQLTKKDLSNEYRHFKALRPSLLRMFSLKQLKIAISELDPRAGKVKILPSQTNIEFTLQSQDPKWPAKTEAKLNQVYLDSLKEYLRQEYYIEFNGIIGSEQSNTIHFKPDHQRFVNEGTEATAPIIKALREKMPNATARVMAKFLLSWIQTIPYDEMESRTTSNGAGYLPPIHVLNHNKGDCDSKATLFAHIMKQLYPKLRMVMIYLPEHALLGMNVSVLSDDKSIEVDGLNFVLTEPVGPALIPFADAADSSLRYIDSGIYNIEKLY